MTQAARRLVGVAGIVAAPLILAALGLTHPSNLTAATAPYWRDLHIALLPLFPLLGVNLWWLAGADVAPLAWAARVAGFIYIAGYTALDVLAGIGAGALVADLGPDAAASATPTMFSQGNALAIVGVWAFLVGAALVGGLGVQRSGLRALPGGAVLVAAAYLFLDSHIYFPTGVIALLGMAIGFGWLQWLRLAPATTPTASDAPIGG